MLENTVLRVERSVFTCSTRLLNSETTFTESVVVVVDSTVGAAAAGAGVATGAGAGAATAAGAGAAVEVEVEAEALRPFLEAVDAEAEEAETDILYREPRNFFGETNAGMLIQLMEKVCVIFSLRGREKATDFCAFDFFQIAFEPKDALISSNSYIRNPNVAVISKNFGIYMFKLTTCLPLVFHRQMGLTYV